MNRTFPVNATVGKIHFIPNGSTDLHPDELSGNLLKGLLGLQEFFREVDQEKIVKPEFLYGNTNRKMARFVSKQFGFAIVNDPPSHHDDHARIYNIVGKTNLVRTHFERLVQKKDNKGRALKDVLSLRVSAEITYQSQFQSSYVVLSHS